MVRRPHRSIPNKRLSKRRVPRPDAPSAQFDSPESVAQELSARLGAHADPRRAKGMQHYFQHQVVALGVQTPCVRRLVRSCALALRPRWTLLQAIHCADKLIQQSEFERRAAGILFLSAFRKQFTARLRVWLNRWLATRLDNWALVDACCGEVVAPLIERLPEAESWLEDWSKSAGLWKRRAALVSLVPSARRGERLDLAYRFARLHLPDPEHLMHKATGWLLREAGKQDMARLKKFLLEHGANMPRTALRYAIERFPTAERGDLLQATRPPASARMHPHRSN